MHFVTCGGNNALVTVVEYSEERGYRDNANG
jgi:hypothetical protein